jgi:hypothetical protein
MALIYCALCKHRVSDSAAFCRSCSALGKTNSAIRMRAIDVDMPFGSIAIKWAIAASPALFILLFLGVFAGMMLGALVSRH